MLKTTLVLIGLLGVVWGQCLTGNDSPQAMHPRSKTILTDARIIFALDSLKKIANIESKDNIFYSPHSIHQALSLAYFGARGSTETSLKKALRIPEELSKVDVQRYYSHEQGEYAARQANASSGYEYKMANRLWIAEQKKLRECMLNFFGNELEPTNFKANPQAARERINQWVSNVTKGHIKDLIPSDGVSEDTDLVLTNAVYFKGQWQSRFEPTMNKRDIFYASSSQNSFVTFMRQKKTFHHVVSEELGAHVLQLPYKGEEVSMIILLPPWATARSLETRATEQGDGIHQLIERINSEAGMRELRDLMDGAMPPRDVEVSLPKFEVEKELPVGQLLEALGAAEVLRQNADLRGFVADGEESLHLGDAVHRARIEVTEDGTTAAAATALFSFRSSRPAEPAVFNANHPFVYLIYDTVTHTILFNGIYRSPSVGTKQAPSKPL